MRGSLHLIVVGAGDASNGALYIVDGVLHIVDIVHGAVDGRHGVATTTEQSAEGDNGKNG